jgi:hypothetical protein
LEEWCYAFYEATWACSCLGLTRERIKELYELHRRGKLVGPQWEQTEQQIIAAANEGRVAGAVEPLGR